MCRSIHPLHNYAPRAGDDEIRAAALQYVRKISGMTRPARANQAAFERAVEQVAAATRTLLADLVALGPPHDREVHRVQAGLASRAVHAGSRSVPESRRLRPASEDRQRNP